MNYEYESQYEYEANTLLFRLPFHTGSEWFCAKNKTVISTVISWAAFELGGFCLRFVFISSINVRLN